MLQGLRLQATVERTVVGSVLGRTYCCTHSGRRRMLWNTQQKTHHIVEHTVEDATQNGKHSGRRHAQWNTQEHTVEDTTHRLSVERTVGHTVEDATHCGTHSGRRHTQSWNTQWKTQHTVERTVEDAAHCGTHSGNKTHCETDRRIHET